MRRAAQNLLLVILATAVALLVAEGVLRLKNASMRDYDIEMWRYARLLKEPSALLGHDHRPDSRAVLQSVLIRTNHWRLRGGPVTERPAPGTRRILVLGNSFALGWGVPEDRTLEADLQRRLQAAGETVEVLNGGVGNYNTERIVERFLTRLAPLNPTDIVLLATSRDGEILVDNHGSWLLRHSELAVLLWSAANRVLGPTGTDVLVRQFHEVYAPGSPGMAMMNAEYAKLAAYARAHGIRVLVAMVPDPRFLDAYPLSFVHDAIRGAAEANGLTYFDLLPAFQGLSPAEVWVMPNDPHPNIRSYQTMADALYPMLGK